MTFNSIEFWVFFAFVFSLYLRLGQRKQNWILLAASYGFYFSIARFFVLLLCFTTVFDFFCGKMIAQASTPGRRRGYLLLSILSNISVLLVFKYLDFFSAHVSQIFGTGTSGVVFNLAVPIGLSFYILQSISYVIDVYRGDCKAHGRLSEYALYIAFFPQLLAGPIERASRMLPQFGSARAVTNESWKAGLWLCFWGLIEKCVVSDNLQARIITPYFQSGNASNGLSTLLVLWSCSMRIYLDFDGYSNIARGVARLMGFDLSANFFLPNYAVSSKDLWRRFHITFYRWARDYIYIPLVKNLRLPVWVALPVVFILSGLWHQVSWTFVCWGAFEAAVILLSEIPGRFLAPIYAATRGLPKFLLTVAGLMSTKFFRAISTAFFVAESVPAAMDSVRPVLQLASWRLDREFLGILFLFLFFTLPLRPVEFLQLRKNRLLAPLELPPPFFAALLFFLAIFWLLYGVNTAQRFVYFQF